jgi:hypothetical protein
MKLAEKILSKKYNINVHIYDSRTNKFIQSFGGNDFIEIVRKNMGGKRDMFLHDAVKLFNSKSEDSYAKIE